MSPRRLQELRDATESDCVLQKLIQVTLGGWPSQKSDTDLDVRAYYNVRHELTVQNGLVFKGNRIVVPTSVQKDIIATVHRSHQGIQGCIRRAKDAVYWPLMNQHITDYISQCSVCNTYRPEQFKEPLIPHSVPDRPWAKVGADLFELQGQHYLLLVDYYSNFLSWHDMVQIRMQRVSSMRCGRSLHVTVHPKCWSRTTVLSSRVGSSERSRSYGTSSMSRAAHDTHRATDKLNEPLEP